MRLDNDYIKISWITNKNQHSQNSINSYKKIQSSPENYFQKKNITFTKKINSTNRESVFYFKFASLLFNNP